jgi:hypothetical protein
MSELWDITGDKPENLGEGNFSYLVHLVISKVKVGKLELGGTKSDPKVGLQPKV